MSYLGKSRSIHLVMGPNRVLISKFLEFMDLCDPFHKVSQCIIGIGFGPSLFVASFIQLSTGEEPPVLASPCHMRGAQNLISLIKHLTQNVTKQISQGPTKGSRLFRFFSPPLDVSAARSPRCAACGQGLSGQRTLGSLGHGNRLRIVPYRPCFGESVGESLFRHLLNKA